MKHKVSFSTLLASLTVGLSIALSFPVAAQNAGQEKSFDGQISSYDQAARTLTVGGQTYQLLPTSRITESDAQASASALATGHKVQGTFKESTEGKREVLTLNITERAKAAIGGTQDSTTAQSGASFQGRLDRIDRDARTLTINGQTYQILPTSRIIGRRGASVELSDLGRNQQVEGTYKESAEGKREVLTLEVTPVRQAAARAQDNATAESGASFEGRVGSIDRNAQTFTVNNQTYRILPTSRILGRQGTPVAVSELTRNQRVAGTYKESAEGNREVITLEIGGNSQDRNQ
jgi:hypothetical protein